MRTKVPKCHFCEHDRGPFDAPPEECKKCRDCNEFQLKSRLTPRALEEYKRLCDKEAWVNDKSESIDRKTALEVLKALSGFMYASHDLFGEKTLVIRRENFELVRKKFLD